MVLSDRSIREELAGGGIVIDPLDEKAIQPSSVDLRVDRHFRVFRNDTTPYIDPKQAQEDLTELVEVAEARERSSFTRASSCSARRSSGCARERSRRAARGKVLPRAPRAADPLDCGLHRPRLGRPPHARALERRQPADHDLPGHEDRPDLVLADVDRGRTPYGSDATGSKYKGQARPDPLALLPQLPRLIPQLAVMGARQVSSSSQPSYC